MDGKSDGADTDRSLDGWKRCHGLTSQAVHVLADGSVVVSGETKDWGLLLARLAAGTPAWVLEYSAGDSILFPYESRGAAMRCSGSRRRSKMQVASSPSTRSNASWLGDPRTLGAGVGCPSWTCTSPATTRPTAS